MELVSKVYLGFCVQLYSLAEIPQLPSPPPAFGFTLLCNPPRLPNLISVVVLYSRGSFLFIPREYTVKKRLAIFPSLAGMSLTKLSQAGKNLSTVFPSRESLVSDIPAGDGKTAYLFYSVADISLGFLTL